MLKILSQKSFIHLLIIFFLTALAYCNILPNQFLAFEINHPPYQKILFTLSFQQQEFFYLGKQVAQTLSFFIGNASFNFHLFSLVLHLTNIFLVYKIVRRISSKQFVPFLAALLFAIHPSQTEAVTQITNFVVLLGSLGVFISFYWFLKSQENQSQKINRYQILSIILFLLTCLYFRQALIFPVLIFIFTVITKKSNQEAYSKAAPYGVIVGIILLIAIFSSSNGLMNYLKENVYLNGLIALKALSRYVITAVIPAVLSYNPVLSDGIYGRFPEDFDKFAVLSQSILDLSVLKCIVILSVIGLCIKKLGKNNPMVIFGGLWFGVCLIPVLSIWPTRIFYSESYLYIANFGYALLVATFISFWLEDTSLKEEKRLIIWFLVASVMLFCVIQSWMRNLDWRSNKSFYTAAVQTNPQSYRMKFNLAKSYIEGLESDKGIALLKEMVVRYPERSELYVLLAAGYKNFNQYKKSIAMLEQAIAIDPQNADAYYSLSETYASWRMYQPAYENLDRAVYYYKKQGRLEEAERIEDILKSFAENLDKDNQASP